MAAVYLYLNRENYALMSEKEKEESLFFEICIPIYGSRVIEVRTDIHISSKQKILDYIDDPENGCLHFKHGVIDGGNILLETTNSSISIESKLMKVILQQALLSKEKLIYSDKVTCNIYSDFTAKIIYNDVCDACSADVYPDCKDMCDICGNFPICEKCLQECYECGADICPTCTIYKYDDYYCEKCNERS